MFLALPGLTGLDKCRASRVECRGIHGRSDFLDCLFFMSIESLRICLARANGSRNGPILTDKVSKCSRGWRSKLFTGNWLCGIDTVNPVSILIDFDDPK